METTIEPKIEQEIIAKNNEALLLQVKDADTYALAGEMLKSLKSMEKHIKTYFEPLKASAYAAWKGICNRENEEIDKLKPASQYLNKQMTDWFIAEEKKRKAEEERLRQEALKQEEEERLAAAIELEKEGYKEEAKAIINEPVYVPPPIVEKTQPKITGLGIRTTWEAVIIDKMQLIKAVAAGQSPLEAIEPNMSFLNKQAVAFKNNLKYPGVVARENKKMGRTRV